MRLSEALGITRGDVVAFTGAGGKTSSLLTAGRELIDAGWRVIAATTTRIAVDELTSIPGAVTLGGDSLRPAAVSRALNQHGFIFLYRDVQNSKVIGLEPTTINELIDAVDSDVILVEADGARRLPFKAPYTHEPVIPSGTTLHVPVVGLNALGVPLDAEHVYNPEAIIAQYGYPGGERVRYPWIASVMRDPELGLKGVPPTARIVGMINRAPTTGIGRSAARLIARLILRERLISAVAFGSVQDADPILEVHRRVGAVVLAAGMSRSMNQPETSKVLLAWDGRPIIKAIVERLNRMRLDDIVIVTGHQAGQVRAVLERDSARFAHNADYQKGDMLSSLKTGLKALPPTISACLVALGDQPQIDPRIVSRILIAYYEGRGKIIAPSYKGRRGHPILIDRSLWGEILNLPKEGAPRDVINAHGEDTYYIETDNENILRDIDTPEDYREALRRAGLG
ncbi:MAG TPA: selenium cofactor biosynthesis protein YqeC [Aggregatilineales bacterium]|nr:selenium cofactor biosynthesis protein YqeC [Aggregatilineales bacterium]